MSKILIVGGNAGGMTAAGRAARINPNLDILVLEQGPYVSYSICGAPYYISGEVSDPEKLLSYSPASFERKHGVRVLTGMRGERIEPRKRRLLAREVRTGTEHAFDYDRLLLATGYRGKPLGLPGETLRNIFSLTWLTDAVAIRQALQLSPRHGVLIGGGLVGMEMAESLRKRNMEVVLIEREDQILPGLDPEISEMAEAELIRNGVQVRKSTAPKTFFADDQGHVRSVGLENSAERLVADLVLVDIGVRPETTLAEEAGIHLGRSGAILVNERLETSAPAVFAAGNCAEATHIVSGQPVFNALGTAANKQGRVAGENLAGAPTVFRGVLNTWVVKIFDLCVARTGLSSREALEAGFRPVAAQISAPAKAAYFPGSSKLVLRAIADGNSRKLLGVQAAGPDAEKRIDVAAVVLTNGMRIEDAAQLDLSYAPPYSQVWDPFLIAMNALLREL